ncbi:helix-turn-helix domain-containing protein [Nesterenkonia sp. E16_7]|uniref:helix-turn-helix domain-containing protein n=1 Tax=unclassified Nesterenkonia TaxID=2629769 RepID=UPI001A91104D|nr:MULTISPECIES: helix-turn-helix domain-containing protein [unclassified Nesterenkonia]MBO0596954.1 helix-turn-helix domain-containing protein [Nesterenkonia sp. E16_10]MBO0598408.1 helix-turn-helix domain-containing protein [Nesterenkonia sp. E16_7]
MTTVNAESRDSAREAAVKVVSARSMVIDGAEVVLTDELRHSLHELFQHTADGEGVEIVAHPEYLSTQQAAEILRISRPTLVRMLDDGLIPFQRRRSHRRISRQALDDYLEAEKTQRARALEDLADTVDPTVEEQPVATR